MPSYKDKHLAFKEGKLTYFDVGYVYQALIEMICERPADLGFQYRAAFERIRLLSKSKSLGTRNIIFDDHFPLAFLPYFSYFEKPEGVTVMLSKELNTPLTALANRGQFNSDLLSHFKIKYFDSYYESYRALVTDKKPGIFLCTSKGTEDMRPLIDYLSLTKKGFILMLDYSSHYKKNEHLYCEKRKIRILENADGSADFIPIEAW